MRSSLHLPFIFYELVFGVSPLCSSLKIVPVAKISSKARQSCQTAHSFAGERGLFSCCEIGMFQVQLTKVDSKIKIMMGRLFCSPPSSQKCLDDPHNQVVTFVICIRVVQTEVDRF